MSKVIDTRELDGFVKNLERWVKEAPKRQEKFLRQEGNKLKNRTKNRAKKLGTKTGNYLKSIKRGEVYDYHGMQSVRVYSYAPHAHLLEHGHRKVNHWGLEMGFVQGHHVFEESAKKFEKRHQKNVEDFLEKEVKRI